MSALQILSNLASKAIKDKLSELKKDINQNGSKSTASDFGGNFITDDSFKTERNKPKLFASSLEHDPIPTSNIKRVEQEKALPKCIPFEAGFEKLPQIPTKMSKRQTKKLRQIEKSKTKGKGWFDMPVQEMTEEKLNDLKIIQMRGVLDPKHFYKKTDSRPGVLPKFFQTGTVVETSADFYSDRIPKKERKTTLVEELLHDAEFKSYKKRKYSEITSKTFSNKRRKHVKK